MEQTITFDWQGLKLPVHSSTRNYVSGLPAQLEWDYRGVSMRETQKLPKEVMMEAAAKAEAFLKSDEGKRKLLEFMGEVVEVFKALMQKDAAWLQTYLGDKRFIFVIGHFRTGGTYLYTELCRIHGVDWKNASMYMSHDGIPTYDPMLFWRKPAHLLIFLFELAQYLVWVKRELSAAGTIIQKRTGYAHVLPILDSIFGARADYVINMRHPNPTSDSIAWLTGQDGKNPQASTFDYWKPILMAERNLTEVRWQQMGFQEKSLLFWVFYHKEVVRDRLHQGKLIPLGYGEDYEIYLKTEAERRGLAGYVPEGLKQDPLSYKDHWVPEPLVENALQEVREFWRTQGWILPHIPLL